MKNRQAMIALAIAAAASSPWRIFNKTPGTPQGDGNWYRISNNADDTTKPIEVEVYGDIGGWGVTAQMFINELKAVDDGQRQIIVAINSRGGDVGDGFAIHNALQRLGDRVTARIDGYALSAAGIIAAGAANVWMHENAMFMMHNPWTFAAGDSEEFRKVADIMDQMVEGIIASFKHRPITVDDDELRRMINAETWLSAAEAKELGLVDQVLTGNNGISNAGSVRILNRYRNLPPELKAELAEASADADDDLPADDPAGDPPADPPPLNTPPDGPAPEDAAKLALEVMDACDKAGIADLSRCIIQASSLKSSADVQKEISRAKDIHNVCVAARLPEKASEFVAAGLSVDQSRSRLFQALVGKGFGEINNNLPTDTPSPKSGGGYDPGDIYAKRKLNAAKGAA